MPNPAKPSTKVERSPKEYVILSFCAAGVLLISPFAVNRFINHETPIALLDSAAVAFMAGLFAYVYKTGETKVATISLTFLFFSTAIISISLKGADQILWCYPTAVGIYYLISTRNAAIVNAALLLVIFFTVQADLNAQKLASFAITLLAVNVFTWVFAHRNEQQKHQLELLSLKDPLTGIGNKRAFDLHLSEFHQSNSDNPNPHSMIIIDIDHFKKVNDTFGHPKGDEALIQLASLIKVELQQGEQVYRIGGEEYVIFPLKLSESDAKDVAEKIRLSVKSSMLFSRFNITISLGIASFQKSETPIEWVSRADTALYTAKRNGRNCSVTHTSEQQSKTLQDAAGI